MSEDKEIVFKRDEILTLVVCVVHCMNKGKFDSNENSVLLNLRDRLLNDVWNECEDKEIYLKVVNDCQSNTDTA